MQKFLFVLALLMGCAACHEEETATPEERPYSENETRVQNLINAYSDYDPYSVEELLTNKQLTLDACLEYDSRWDRIVAESYAFGVKNDPEFIPDRYLLREGGTAIHYTLEEGVWVATEGTWSFDAASQTLCVPDQVVSIVALTPSSIIWDKETTNVPGGKPRFYRIIYKLSDYDPDQPNPTPDPDDLIFDFVNYSIFVSLLDVETGADLLNPETEGNILGNEICAYYLGESYPRWAVESLTADRPEDLTRAMMPIPLGLRWGRVAYYEEDRLCYSDCYYLAFGEFAPGEYRNEPFVIDWGDGTQTEFRFDCYITWNSPTDPVVHRNLWVDGAEYGENWMVTITREPKQPTEEELFIQKAEEQMAELLERSGDYDPERVTEMLCGKDFLQWALLGYDSTWSNVISPIYVFGEWLWVGLSAEGYRFEADGTMVWTPGESNIPDVVYEPVDGQWVFDPATRTLSILYDGETEREDYTLIALDESTFSWERERIFYEKDGSESFRDYLRSVYIMQ